MVVGLPGITPPFFFSEGAGSNPPGDFWNPWDFFCSGTSGKQKSMFSGVMCFFHLLRIFQTSHSCSCLENKLWREFPSTSPPLPTRVALNKWCHKLCFPGIKKSTHHFGELGIFLHHSVSKKCDFVVNNCKKNQFPQTLLCWSKITSTSLVWKPTKPRQCATPSQLLFCLSLSEENGHPGCWVAHHYY